MATAISHEAGSGMRAGFKHIQAIDRVSATILGDGTAVTWAMVKWAVTAVLRREIEANVGAAAALVSDGSVVTWGHAGCRNVRKCAGTAEGCASGTSH